MSSPKDYELPHDEWRPYQQETVEWASDVTDYVAKIAEQSTGCHAKGQGILMFDGSIKNVEDVIVGDLLMGPDSHERTVLRLCRGYGKMYKITPVKGSSFIVNEEHKLTLVKTNKFNHDSNKKFRKDCEDGLVVDISVKDYLKLSQSLKHLYKLFKAEINFGKNKLKIDPYFLGVLLGDGSLGPSIRITTTDSEIINEIYKQASNYEMLVSICGKNKSSVKSYCFVDPNRGSNNALRRIHKLRADIKEYGLLNINCSMKFVPDEYKTSTKEDRLEILAGLIDTDGHLGTNCYDYISKSEQLATDVVFIARSVGLSAYIKESYKTCQTGNGGIYYRVSISGNTDKIPCRIKYKKATPRLQKKNVLRNGFSVEQVEDDNYYGFELDCDPHYLLDDFTVTHNSGKTHVAMAQSVPHGQVVAMTKTKSLQNQYRDGEYGCVAVYGASNYPCLHMRAAIDATAGECLYPSKPNNCEVFRRNACEYFNVHKLAKDSDRVVINYALWLGISNKVLRPHLFNSDPWLYPEYLVMDEAHTISDLVLDHVGIEFTEKQREKWLLPEFPVIKKKSAFIGFKTENTSRASDALKWISDSYGIVLERVNKLEASLDSLDERKLAQLRQLRILKFKLEMVKDSLRERPGEHWFIRSGPNGLNSGPGLLCKPITARYDAPLFFEHPRTLFMSATIGRIDAFVEELGIKNYESRIVPSQFAPRQRPVRILPVGSMGKSAVEKDELAFEKQANAIATAILDCPNEWSGFILVTRKSEAKLLADRLARRGLQDRVWVTPGYDGEYSPTNEQLRAWQKRLRDVPNSLCVTWAFWEGIDGVNQRICIVAKAPYIMETEYEQARREYDHKYYLQRAAYIMEQGLGRTRRGNIEDYDNPETGDVNGLVAIADGSWTKLKSYLSQSLQESIVE